MSILANFPHVSQQTSITGDNKPSENALFDCVPASIAACILWYKGFLNWNVNINPDKLKDAAYNDAYTGGTAASAYTAICKSMGFNLYPIENASPYAAVAKAHSLIQSGLPVIFTQQDDYSTNRNFTHVCVFFAEGSGNLTALDCFPTPNGAIIQYSDSVWASRLRSTEIWSISPINALEVQMLQLTDPMGRFFVAKAANIWHCSKTNADIHDAHLDFFRKYEGITGLPLTSEIYLASMPGTSIQIYERGIAIYDPSHHIDNPPGSGPVYLLHIDEGTGQEIIAKPLTDALNAKVSQLTEELAKAGDTSALHSQITTLQNELAAYKAGLASLHTALDTLDKTA